MLHRPRLFTNGQLFKHDLYTKYWCSKAKDDFEMRKLFVAWVLTVDIIMFITALQGMWLYYFGNTFLCRKYTKWQWSWGYLFYRFLKTQWTGPDHVLDRRTKYGMPLNAWYITWADYTKSFEKWEGRNIPRPLSVHVGLLWCICVMRPLRLFYITKVDRYWSREQIFKLPKPPYWRIFKMSVRFILTWLFIATLAATAGYKLLAHHFTEQGRAQVVEQIKQETAKTEQAVQQASAQAVASNEQTAAKIDDQTAKIKADLDRQNATQPPAAVQNAQVNQELAAIKDEVTRNRVMIASLAADNQNLQKRLNEAQTTITKLKMSVKTPGFDGPPITSDTSVPPLAQVDTSGPEYILKIHPTDAEETRSEARLKAIEQSRKLIQPSDGSLP